MTELRRQASQHAHLLAAQHPRLPVVHGDRRHPEDLGQHHGDHHDRGLDARGRPARHRRVRRAQLGSSTARRVAAEPVPPAVRDTFRVSALLAAATARSAAGRTPRASWRTRTSTSISTNPNRSLNADFLEVIYRMAAGRCRAPRTSSSPATWGRGSLDGIGLQALARTSLAWSLGAARARPGARSTTSRSRCRAASRGPARAPAGADGDARDRGGNAPLASCVADACGGFELELPAGHPVEAALARGAPLALTCHVRRRPGARPAVELVADGHGGRGRRVVRAARDGTVTLRRAPSRAGGHVV